MKVKELIKLLAEQDMEANACIRVGSVYYNHAMPITEVSTLPWHMNERGDVVIFPERDLTPDHELDDEPSDPE